MESRVLLLIVIAFGSILFLGLVAAFIFLVVNSWRACKLLTEIRDLLRRRERQDYD